MTVSATTPLASSTANGVSTVFPFAFQLLAATDLVVKGLLSGSPISYALGTDYTVNITGSTGGSIQFLVAPANGTVLTYYRDTSISRTTQYQNNGDLLAATVNADFDKIYLLLLESFSGGKSSTRSVRAPAGESLSDLPAASARLNKMLSFDPTTGDVSATSFTVTQVASAVAAAYAAGSTADAVTFIAAGSGATSRSTQSKLRDRPSPEDYGADPTGATDSSAAFTAGYLVNKALYGAPNAIYKLKDVTLNGTRFYGQGCVLRPMTGANFVMKLKGYQPAVSDFVLQDTDDYSHITTLASGAAYAATSLVVNNGAGFAVDQPLFIDIDAAGSWHQTTITSVVGNTIGIRDALPSTAASGKSVVALWGAIWVEDQAAYWKVDNVHVVNARGAFLNRPPTGSFNNKGSLTRFSTDGIKYFGALKMGDAAGMKADDIKLWGGFVTTANATGNGTAGPFTFSTAGTAFLARDLTVTVNGVAKVNPTHWTFAANGTDINFTSGNFPAGGAAIVMSFYQCGLRGFIEDARNANIISGGNDYGRIEALGCFVGTHLNTVQLTTIDALISDSNQFVGLQVDGCLSNVNIKEAFLGFNLSSLKSFNSAVTVGRLYTQRVPSSYLARPSVTDDNIYVDATTAIDLNAGEWYGGDYQVNGAGKINWRGGRQINFTSTPGSTVPAATTAYLNAYGHTTTAPNVAQLIAGDSTALEFIAQCSTAPGAGQSFTYTLNVNGVDDAGSTGSISGASSFSVSIRSTKVLNKGDRVLLKLVTSATAAASEHRAVGVVR